MKKNVLRTGIATAAVFGATAGAIALGAGSASAMPTDHGYCNASQVTTALVPGDAGAGQHHAALQVTANPGQICKIGGTLFPSLVNAPAISVVEGAPGTEVTLAPGQSAHLTLSWSAVQVGAEQVTPDALSVLLPGERGDVVTVPWNADGIDNFPQSHHLTVDGIQAGPAEQA
jgi:hypothetical protein